MWLKVPVEEEDEAGKERMKRGRRGSRVAKGRIAALRKEAW
jgi:hypothetical protein